MTRLQISLAAVACGLLAAAAIAGNELGLGFFLVVLCGTVVVVAARPTPLSAHSIGFGGLALLLAGMSLWRAADWVVAVDLVAALAIASFAITGGSTRQEVVRGLTALVTGLGRGVGFLFTPMRGRVGGLFRGRAVPVVRGLAIGAYLILIFGFLFATADRAFLHLASRFASPSLGVSEFPIRVYLALIFFVLIGGMIAIGPRFSTYTADPFTEERKPQGLAFLEWVLPLGLLNALFIGFVLVQLTVLFGGHQHVLDTVDLSYAQYARAGFFQLLAVAFLTLAVVGAAVRWARTQGTVQKLLLRGLLTLLCTSTLIVLASALKRLMVYEDAYGLTRLRISVHAVILVLAVVFTLVIAATLTWRGQWLARTSVAIMGIALLTFSLVNPDALIARQNVERFDRSGVIDAAYLTSLSVDAADQLDDLPEPLSSCIVRGLDGVDTSSNWAEFNFARSRAQDEVDTATRQVGSGCLTPSSAWEGLVE